MTVDEIINIGQRLAETSTPRGNRSANEMVAKLEVRGDDMAEAILLRRADLPDWVVERAVAWLQLRGVQA